MRLSPDFAPVWWSSSSGTPSNVPPTRPSLARNSSMIWALKSAGDVDMVLLRTYTAGTSRRLYLSGQPRDAALGRGVRGARPGPGDRLLDIGCGSGAVVRRAVQIIERAAPWRPVGGQARRLATPP